MKRFCLRIAAFFVSLACAINVPAFTFVSTPPEVWPSGVIHMDLQLGPTLPSPLKDGRTSFNAVAKDALEEWNGFLNVVQFTSSVRTPTGPIEIDAVNQVIFDSTVEGQEIEDGILALTAIHTFGSTIIETDVVFNSAEQWDSYRGPLQATRNQQDWLVDLRRVALHEFGHVLGLDHPDEAGQSVVAIMNSVMSDLDHLSADDALGARALYGGAPVIVTGPRSQTVAAGSEVTFSVLVNGIPPFSYQWLFNDLEILGATNATYSIERVQSSQGGKYSVVVTNVHGLAISAPATLTIDSATAFGVLGAPFSYQIVANNSPRFYSATGLPPGLFCNGRTGLITGVPTRTGVYLVRVKASNAFGSTSAEVSFSIAEGLILPLGGDAVIGVPFGYQIFADNDPNWYSASGLPRGLMCDGLTGEIAGVPTQTGVFQVRVKASNLYGTATATIPIIVGQGAIISPPGVNGVVGVPLQYRLIASNDPLWFTVSGLPPGLSCIQATGLILGIPTKDGVFVVPVEAKNLYGTAAGSITFEITNGIIAGGTSPSLSAVRTSESFTLAWPVDSSGFVLEETDLQGGNWTNSPATATVRGNENVVEFRATSGAKFFRLRK